MLRVPALLASLVLLPIHLVGAQDGTQSTSQSKRGLSVQDLVRLKRVSDPALSPDAALVSYVAGPLGQTRLYVRQVDGGTPVALTPAGGGFARMPRWSPDGRRLLFLSARGLEVMPALGGASKLILAAEP